MPAIKPRTAQKHPVRHITRLFRENNETLFSYAAYIGEPTEYIPNQLVETVLARDRDFQGGAPSIRARMCRERGPIVIRRAQESRAPWHLGLAAVVGVLGLRLWLFPVDNAFRAVIDARKPWLFDGLAYLYLTLGSFPGRRRNLAQPVA